MQREAKHLMERCFLPTIAPIAAGALLTLAGCDCVHDLTIDNQLADPIRVDHLTTEPWEKPEGVERWNIPAASQQTVIAHNPHFNAYFSTYCDDDMTLDITPLVLGPASRWTWKVVLPKPGPYSLVVRGDGTSPIFERVDELNAGQAKGGGSQRLKIEKISPKEEPSPSAQ